jgi:protein-tyrosine phosphatase
MSSDFSPQDFVIQPTEEAWVERLPDGDLLLRWHQRAERVAVYVSDDPDGLTADGRPLATEKITNFELRIGNADMAAVSGRPSAVANARPYFLLDLDGRRLVVAERTLPLAGGVNFRDLGGYRTADGRSVRWGRVYRAGSLAELTDDDVTYLEQLGLRLSCDLRSPDEAERNPDRLPPGAVLVRRPIVAEVGRLRRIVTLFRLRHRIQELLQNAYAIMLDQNGAIFAKVIRLAADPANLPLVVHCTAGKDRTGLATALLLLALGVPEETVVADYTLSNRAFDVLAGRMRPEMERLYALGFGETQLRPFLLAEARTLTGALAYLRRRYGSFEGYLRRTGIDDEVIERLKATLLTADGESTQKL